MSEARTLLADSAAKAFQELPADFGAAWRIMEEAGFALVLVPEAKGGFGGGWEDVNAILRAAGAAGVDLPLAEAIIANGVSPGEGTASIATDVKGALSGDRFTGEMHNVAFGRDCARVVAQIDATTAVSVANSGASVMREYRNLAGEPRADLRFENASAQSFPGNNAPGLFQLGALARTCQMAGALNTALTMTIEHAKTRQQFGRAIGNFQAIQQQLAVFASETAAAGAAAASACRAVDRGKGELEIASAKLRANRAVDIATSAAHQIHGAIGITQEHTLHRYTQRLWAWKSEYGNDRFWAAKLGGEIASRGADAFWPALTAQ
jgi:acyl-CoA dehydrogenase